MGPLTAYKLIKQYGSFTKAEPIIKKKYEIPDNFDYTEIRELFMDSDIDLYLPDTKIKLMGILENELKTFIDSN